MNPRRKTRPHSGHERWLVSYADFITLLFAFFVVLFASSQVDKKKTDTLASAIQSAFQGRKNAVPGSFRDSLAIPRGQANPPQQNPLEAQLRSALASELDQQFVSLEAGAGELTLSLKEVGFFDSGSADLREASAASVEHIAAVLKQYTNPVRVEGHTDNVPIATAKFASNWELSTARAIEITRLLTAKFGIEPARLSVAGFAEYRPLRPNTDSSGRAANRRVDIVILGPVTRPSAP